MLQAEVLPHIFNKALMMVRTARLEIPFIVHSGVIPKTSELTPNYVQHRTVVWKLIPNLIFFDWCQYTDLEDAMECKCHFARIIITLAHIKFLWFEKNLNWYRCHCHDQYFVWRWISSLQWLEPHTGLWRQHLSVKKLCDTYIVVTLFELTLHNSGFS